MPFFSSVTMSYPSRKMAWNAGRCQSSEFQRVGLSAQVPLHLLELLLADLTARVSFLENLQRGFITIPAPAARAAEIPNQVHGPNGESGENHEPESRPYPPERETVPPAHT